MASPYQEFVRKAKERYEENKKKKLLPKGGIEFTAHSRYKMAQYGLSEQKVKGVIRSPRRTETGVVPNTVAVMQPVGMKRIEGKPIRNATQSVAGGDVWKQEIWVMYLLKKNQESGIRNQERGSKSRDSQFSILNSANRQIRIISAWRYPGVSPKRSPIPRDILQELEDGSILEAVL